MLASRFLPLARCSRVLGVSVPARAMSVGIRVDHAKECLAKADAVCFDVDSTVIKEEGIDEFAAFLGVGEEVAALTAAAMGGDTPFHVALENRLKVMQPTKQKLDAMIAANPAEGLLTTGVKELIDELQAGGKVVYLVSGGFRQMIAPIAAAVNVKTHIYANSFTFHEDGSWKCHDDTEPTSRAGGKAKVVAELKAKHGYKTVVMVGDGATDMEARDVEGGADAFIGFGGIQVREKVKAGADWFVYDFDEMRAVLK